MLRAQKRAMALIGVSFFLAMSTVTAEEPVNVIEGTSVEQRLSALENNWDSLESWLTELDIGGALRVRHEYKSPFNYTAASGNKSDDQTLLRTRLNFGFKASDHFSARVQMQDSRAYGDAGGLAADTSNVDIRQAYITVHNVLGLIAPEQDFSETQLTINLGRIQLPALGNQRMFSPLDWSNVGRSFDGVHFDLSNELVQIHVIGANLTEEAGVTGAGKDDQLYVVYASTKAIKNATFDAYAAWRNFQSTAITGEDGFADDLEDATYGVRGDFSHSGFGVVGEFAMQTGDSGTDSVEAHGWVAEASYRFAKDGPLPWQPKIIIGNSFASGDGDPTDGDEETFKPIAPFGHAYQGHYDAFSWQNGNDTYIKTVFWPSENSPLELHADFHWFRLDQAEDAWYNAGGGVIRSDASGTSGRTVGRELDIYIKTTIDKRAKLWAGWSHFFDGNYVDKSGLDDSGDFFFAQCELFFGK